MFIKISRLIAITTFLALFSGVFFEQRAIAEEESVPPQQEVNMSMAFGLLTRHVSPGEDTNDDTDFVALSIDKYAIARFINSYNDETWFGGFNFHTPKKKLLKDSELFLQGNLYAGIVHGYKEHLPDIGGFTPVPLPTVGIGYKRFAIEFMYFPSPSGGVFSSALRIDLSWRKPRVRSHDPQISEPVTR